MEIKVSKESSKKRLKGREQAKNLMAAAIDLFIENEYSSVTISDITTRAGVTHSLVYYHFKNKEQLFHRAVAELVESTINSYAEKRKRHDSPVDLIKDWFESNISLSDNLGKLVMIMFKYSRPGKNTPSVTGLINNFYDEEYEILTVNVRLGISQGIFKKVDPLFIASFVSTHIDGIFYSSFVHGRNAIEADMRELKNILWLLLGYSPDKASGSGIK